MRVLVTGGAGFIGSGTANALKGGGCRVAVLDNLSTGKIDNIGQNIKLYRGDLRDSEFVLQCIENERPEVIMHLAAQVSVPESLRDPAADAMVNIVGTVNLLEGARAAGVKKIIYTSSAAVYGAPVYLPVDEKHPLKPLSGYGVSKRAAEEYLSLYRELCGLDYTVLRYANVYGPGQGAQGEGGVVAIFIDRILRGERPVIYGDGEQTRDFVHVSDVVRANLCALEMGGGMIFNIGTGLPLSVNSVFEAIKNESGLSVEPVYRPVREGDIRDSLLDCTGAASSLGWVPALRPERGIRETYLAQADLEAGHGSGV